MSFAEAHGVNRRTPTEQKVLWRFRALLAAENAHDIASSRAFFRNAPDLLFVGKTPPGAQDNWSGFWGPLATMQIGAVLSSGGFMISERAPPRISKLSHGVVQLYAPVSIAVAYGHQSGTARPFVLILEWVRDQDDWKIATDAVPA